MARRGACRTQFLPLKYAWTSDAMNRTRLTCEHFCGNSPHFMNTRFVLSLIAAFALVGCKDSTPPTSGPTVTGPASAASVVASGEMKATASGLKYQVLKQGTGTVSPKPTDNVNVHYHGMLLNGTVFDSSVQRGEPISFPLNGVIAGWTEGLQLMHVGDKFKFEIPPGLAYGADSPSPLIPPNSTLVFEVELLGIK